MTFGPDVVRVAAQSPVQHLPLLERARSAC